MRTFSGVAWLLLVYCCWRATLFATGQGAARGASPALGISWFYPVASMAVGYYFITLHYAAGGRGGGGAGGGRAARACAAPCWRWPGRPSSGRPVAGDVGLLEAGATPLIALGVLFVALTLAGTPIVFMLSIVGIVAMPPGIFGLEFYPSRTP